MKKGWEYKRLPEMSENLDSLRKPVTKKNRTAGIYPYYGASGIVDYVDDYLFDEDLLCISEDGANLLMRTYPIAFPISGKVWVNNHAHVLRFKDMATQKYVEYFFAGFKLDEYITGAAQPKLTQKALNNITIKIPISLSEQQRIVDYLDSAFAKIDAMKANAEKSLNEAKALFQASLKEMLEPKEGWEEKTLKEICVFSQGVQVPLSNQSMTKEYGFTRFLRIIDFTQGGELPRYVPIVDKKYWMKKDEVAIVRYGASAGYICTGLEGTLANNLFKVSIKSNENLSSKYLVWWLRSDAFQSIIKKIMNGAAMPAISFGMINDISLIYPPLSEQQSIVATLDSLKSKVDRLQANFEKISQECDALKQAILRQIFE